MRTLRRMRHFKEIVHSRVRSELTGVCVATGGAW